MEYLYGLHRQHEKGTGVGLCTLWKARANSECWWSKNTTQKPYLEPYFCGQAFIASMCFCARTAAYLYKFPISVISNFSFLFDWLSIILLTIDNCTLCHKSPIWLNWTMIVLTAVWDSGHPPFMRLFTQPHDHAQWPRDYSRFSPRFSIDMPTVSSLPHFNNCKW